MAPRLQRVLAGLLLLAVLGGCGGPGAQLAATGTPGPGTAAPGEPAGPAGRVRFMVTGDPAEKAAYEQLVASFEQGHPAIDVEIQHIPSASEYRKRLVADFAAGTPADVVLLNYRRYASFAARGVLQPLGPYLARSLTVRSTDFYTEALKPFYWRGVLTCIPQNLSSLAVYYNKQLFDQAGVAYPAADWTWDDFLATARTLTRDSDGDGRADQYGAGLEPTLIRAAPFIWQNGGELVFNPDAPTRLSLDKPEALEALQWFIDLQLVHQVVPPLVEAESEELEARFMNGRLAMYFDSRRAVPTLREITAFDWDVAPLPRGRQVANVLHADAYCLPAASQNKDAAWALIEYANSETGQTVIAATGRTVPSLRPVAESRAFLDPGAKPANSRVWLDALDGMRHLPVLGTWVEIEEAVDAEIERAFYGQVSLEEAVATANARVVEYLKLTVELQPTPIPNAPPTPTPIGGIPLPECAAKVSTVPLIAEFPADFPFPPGSVFIQSYAYPEDDGFYALAVVPTPMFDVIKYYQDNLTATGYALAPGDAEPGEIDLLLSGNGRAGNLRAGIPLGCEAVTVVEVTFWRPK
jgi:multiple sugar transport system substrate-binding protein